MQRTTERNNFGAIIKGLSPPIHLDLTFGEGYACCCSVFSAEVVLEESSDMVGVVVL